MTAWSLDNRPGREQQPERNARIRALRAAGWKQIAIAALFGLDVSTIRAVLNPQRNAAKWRRHAAKRKAVDAEAFRRQRRDQAAARRLARLNVRRELSMEAAE